LAIAGPASKNGASATKPPREPRGKHNPHMSVNSEGVLTMRSSSQSAAPTTHYVLTRVSQ
jgi:hypothetical protein